MLWSKKIWKLTTKWNHWLRIRWGSASRNLVKFTITMDFCRRPINSGSSHLICLFKMRTYFRCHTLSLKVDSKLNKNTWLRSLQKMQLLRTLTKALRWRQLRAFLMQFRAFNQSLTKLQSLSSWKLFFQQNKLTTLKPKLQKYALWMI